MKTRKHQLEMALLCAQLGDEDGLDPRYRRKTAGRKNRTHQHDRFLRQAERGLRMALSASSNPILQSLDIVSVSGFANRLRVLVAPLCGENAPSRADAEQALSQALGHLRCSLGAAISRKRVPQLVFELSDGLEGEHV